MTPEEIQVPDISVIFKDDFADQIIKNINVK